MQALPAVSIVPPMPPSSYPRPLPASQKLVGARLKLLIYPFSLLLGGYFKTLMQRWKSYDSGV